MIVNNIYLYWWGLDREDGKDNYGDILGPYVVSKLSNKKIKRVKHPMMRRYRWFVKHYLTIGSIIGVAGPNTVVWGSGIMSEKDNVRRSNFVAVRGPRTRKRLLELGYDVEENYGDPAILLPDILKNNIEKKYDVGIIPHYVDYDLVIDKFKDNDKIKVIDLMTNDVEATTKEIMECKLIVSSSLHGIIVSHAYEIPAVWVEFSGKLAGDGVKFYDYFESVGINSNETSVINIDELDYDKLISLFKDNDKVLPDAIFFQYRKSELLRVCPFL